MPLTGQAKTDYQREYMRKRRAGVSVPNDIGDTSGFVYIIHCFGTSYYKIGRSHSMPLSRMADLQIGCPYELILVHYTYSENSVGLERLLQECNERCHIRGEWYKFNNEDIAEIQKYI